MSSSLSLDRMSFLGLEGLHVFITGAAGGIGTQAVTEFLSTIHTVFFVIEIF